MQTITTTYKGPTDFQGSRIVARASGGSGRVTWPVRNNESIDWNHEQAAKSVATKLGWSGDYVGGHTKTGMVWVRQDSEDYFSVFVGE